MQNIHNTEAVEMIDRDVQERAVHDDRFQILENMDLMFEKMNMSTM